MALRSAMAALRPVVVVAGLGSNSGTGAATARLFAKHGYGVALIARGVNEVHALTNEINANGGVAEGFPIPSYSSSDVVETWNKIRSRFPSQSHVIRGAVFNAGHGAFKKFLDVTEEDLKAVSQINIEAAFAFSREAILEFKKNEINSSEDASADVKGKRGFLIFTGATGSIRGNVMTSAFAAGKFALRALSQSLAKEFGKENIHVTHSIIDGGIITNLSRSRRNDPEWEANADVHLTPEGIAEAYWYLANQPRSTWTWELDLRPAHEKW